ncbi:MAG: class I adenylate-forming enzyme family protein, partial [Alphaproteobacteria bacterium]|nr:class I adenylate-forming enzyme family protein [Alphaproteobacteria bacterium]
MIAKNIYEMLQDVCSRNKDGIFFVRQNETYAELLKKVKQRAVLLAKRFKIKKGDTVAILSGNTPDFLRTYFAITSQGARALMLDTGLQTTEHINMMKRTDCKLVLAQKHYFIEDAPCEMFDIENIDDTDENEFVMADTERSDIAQLSFTSGSTGNPKVVGLTHENLLSLSDGAQFYKDVILPGYTFYGFLPLYHIYGVVINIIVPVSLQGKL